MIILKKIPIFIITICFAFSKMTFIEHPLSIGQKGTLSIQSADINKDGYNDLILGGNLSKIKPEYGPSKSSYSSLFIGKKDIKFEYINSNKSGLFIDGDLRDLTKIKINKKDSYIFALNNSKIKILERE